jgi:hypothetical protein
MVMKISANLHPVSTLSENYIKQNQVYDKESEVEKLGASKEKFITDRIVTGESARTAEECGLVISKAFVSKTTVAGADGSVFTVSSYYDASGDNSLNESYENVLLKKASGAEVSNFDLYISNLTSDITSYFSTKSSLENDKAEIKGGINDVLAEISRNIQDGKENPLADLQTTLNVNGIDWKFSDILNTMSVMSEGLDGFKTSLSLDYSDYAKMGVAIGFANTYAKENLNEEQCSYVNDIMQAKTNYLAKRQNEWVAANLADGQSKEVYSNSTEREKYYSLGSYKIATGMDLANTIKDLFANCDYTNEKSVSDALKQYGELLRPVRLADGTNVNKVSQVLQKDVSAVSSMYMSCLNTLSNVAKNRDKEFETFV